VSGTDAEAARTGPWRDVLCVAAVAAAVRAVWVLFMSREPAGLSDPILYVTSARFISEGEGYRSLLGTPTSYYPPGYPYFLGAARWVLSLVGAEDQLVLTAGLLQALLGGVAAGALVIAGRRLGGRAVGLVAGLVLALWPNLIAYTSVMLSESLFVALWAVFLAALVHLDGDRHDDAGAGGGSDADGAATRIWPPRVPAIIAAASLGAACLVRPQSALLAVPAAGLAWALARVGWRATLARMAVLSAGVVLVVMPWTVRNAVVLDGFVPVSTNTGDNLCVGFHEGASGGFQMPPDCDTGEFYTDGPAAELRREEETRRRAIEWATANLGELPGLSVDKVRLTFRTDDDSLFAIESYGADPRFSPEARRTLSIGWNAYYWTVMAFAALGGLAAIATTISAALRRRHGRPVDGAGASGDPLVVLALSLTGVLVPVLSFGDARFKLSIVPCLALLAAYGALSVVRAVSGALSGPAPHPSETRERVESPSSR
jgi:hypothetical protein